ncbi:MAG: hypothetical protein ACLRM9_00175 [Collinsella aerofaciens]
MAPKHLFNQLLDAVSWRYHPDPSDLCVAGIFKMLVILFGPEGAGFMSETSDRIDPFPGGRCGVLLLPGVCRL